MLFIAIAANQTTGETRIKYSDTLAGAKKWALRYSKVTWWIRVYPVTSIAYDSALDNPKRKPIAKSV